MIQQYWSQQGPRTLWLVTLGVAAIIGASALLTLTDTHAADERVDDIAKKLRVRPAIEQPNNAQAQRGGHGRGWHGGGQAQATPSDPAGQATQRIRDRFLFMPPPPQGFRNVQGVLGDRVLYPGGQSFGLGENAMGATVVAIGTNWVELLHEEQTITIDIFRGVERGPELMRWDGEAADSSASSGNQAQGQMNGNNSGRPDRSWRQRDRGERGERGSRGDRSGRPRER
ncbi:hypothetical protein [Algisphaera agarilytica]|uniref:Uncharacterized protein n=1 Tax=Algisphaera agarilytica TaxID=1385975 RepID=A0A7X0LKR6_9BACT|nr:hypothetical protein [Algisphaera agarilytica]MBB6429901.1 hypothetical protein [Algisphaera agarilytica]